MSSTEDPATPGPTDTAPLGPRSATPAGLAEVAATFLKLGCVSFGGPIAHLGYFRAELVDKRRWIDDAHYADLVALCQFLPGPASSQVVFALGMRRAGLLGALVASICFTLPSALLMIGFAYGVAVAGDLRSTGWLHGLKLAAAAVVAQAVWGMGKKLCPDRARISICIAAAAVVLAATGPIAQVGVIAGGGVIGWWRYRREVTAASLATEPPARHHVFATAALVMFFGLLAALPALTSATGDRRVAELDSFYRSGSLVFGGGHVVLPLLRAEVVPSGWLTDDQFLAGYGAAQALPGPLFAFSAYLGAAMASGVPAWLNGVWCLFAIFLPSWLLIGGALPFWHRLRAKPWVQAALAGANAAVVGVLLAALYSPVITEGIRDRFDAVAALVAFGVLEHGRAPPWLIVIAMAAAGQWVLHA
jgi:chromate transporter